MSAEPTQAPTHLARDLGQEVPAGAGLGGGRRAANCLTTLAGCTSGVPQASEREPWLAALSRDEGFLEVDLTGTDFVHPVGSVVIACLVDRAGALGWPITFLAPRKWDASAYLYRVGLASLLQDGGCYDHGLQRVTSHDPGLRFIELSRFSASGGDDLPDQLVQMIETQLDSWNDASLSSVMI